MSFSIRHVQEKDLDLVILQEVATGTEVALLPGYGACLHAFRVRLQDAPFNVIDHYSDRSELEREMPRSFKGPKLSPFPCRIAGGKYQFEGEEYQFERMNKDGTAIHGLLFDRPFTVLDEVSDASSASVSMEYRYKNEQKGYPFNYVCAVRYVLHPENVLEIVTTVTNLDKKVIPVADGWHPYFRLGGAIDGWQLQFHASAIVEFDERLIPTGRLVQYDVFDSPHPIGDTFLDNCYVRKAGIVSPACELYNPANGLKVSFYPDEQYPYLQLFTPPTRDSFAVENLSAAPDAFNNNMGLSLLEPGHSQIFTVRYKVSIA